MSPRSRVGRFLRSMKLRARPSKTYLHRLFDADLAAYSDVDRAADVASADFKNAHMFDSDVYYAVDVDEAGLRAGLESVDSGTTDFLKGPIDAGTMTDHDAAEAPARIALLGDMRHSLFPLDSLDLIASTHTFGHVPPSNHPTVVEHFCEALRPGGTLLLQLGQSEWYDDELESKLTDAFNTVETRRYRVPTSVAYERLVATEDGRVVFPHDRNKFNHYLMELASAGLLQVERIGLFGGASVYVRCLGRR